MLNEGCFLVKNARKIAGERNRKEYFKNGVFHRDYKKGPAVSWDGPVEQGGSEMFYKNGLFHRPSTMGPALINSGGIKRGGAESYWCEGKLHRHWSEGPARVYGDWIEYWWEGNLHRDPLDGPAWIYETEKSKIEKYYVNGVEYPDKDAALVAWLKQTPSLP